MNFVYICRDGDNEELRFSIRSVKHFYPDSNVWVVGGKPDWYCGNYIDVKQVKNKNANINMNLKAAYDCKDIPDDFIYMNDDFFILKYIESFDPMYDGLLQDKIIRYEEQHEPNGYSRQLRYTYTKLQGIKISNPLNYELHVPIPVHKPNLAAALSRGDQALWRSIYGNMFNIGGVQSNDVKIYKSMIDTGTFASTSEGLSFDILFDNVLKDMFNKPNEHECDMI